MLDPVEVAYRHHAPTEPAAYSSVGVCCRCGQTVPVQSISSVVSAKFTGFDLLGDGDGLCRGCSWAFSTPARRLVLSITATAATPPRHPFAVRRPPASKRQLRDRGSPERPQTCAALRAVGHRARR
jgi:hypothetical protein